MEWPEELIVGGTVKNSTGGLRRLVLFVGNMTAYEYVGY